MELIFSSVPTPLGDPTNQHMHAPTYRTHPIFVPVSSSVFLCRIVSRSDHICFGGQHPRVLLSWVCGTKSPTTVPTAVLITTTQHPTLAPTVALITIATTTETDDLGTQPSAKEETLH
mmetsp:Transcript_42868/g.47699  ORF Transcript_42868/g.47699 Transcript_42868/m.47699 type:complete len:118 (+) Transcript_42868:371-724(+)